MASMAGDSKGNDAVEIWQRAVTNFEKAGKLGWQHRKRAFAELGLAQALYNFAENKSAESAAVLAKAYLVEGMWKEAAKICGEHCPPRLQGLEKRIGRGR
jgi:hypothetical protein